MNWIDDARRIGPVTVAEQLGLDVRSRAIQACPACGQGKGRSCKLFVTQDGGGWKCWRCGEGGDTLDLVRRVTGCAFPEVRAWFAARGWCEGNSYTPRPAKPVEVRPEPPPTYPPVGDVERLWRACRPAMEDRSVTDWLRDRLGADWHRVASLVRAAPDRLPWMAGHWTRAHRCVVPVWDAEGRLRSMRARAVVPAIGPKGLPLRGHAAAGLVLANPPALALLRGQRLPHPWPDPVPVVVTEGEPRFLAWSCRRREAVFGIVSGAWTQAHADRLPTTTVLIDTDHDDAGDRYADLVTGTLAHRCTITRR